MKKLTITLLVLFAHSGSCLFSSLYIKDYIRVKGVQSNELQGIGLVTGLAGTGDKKSPKKDEMLQAFVANHGLDMSVVGDSKNVAIVEVTGEISAFIGEGQHISFDVSTFGDAKSLKGGVLQFTRMKYSGDPSGKPTIWATVQGPVEVSGSEVLTTGSVDGVVLRSVPTTLVRNGSIHLLLNKPDFVDAVRIARSINQSFSRKSKGEIAHAQSAGEVRVRVPQAYKGEEVGLMAEIEKIPVLFSDVKAKVRINSKTKMVTFNERVEISPFSFSYNDITVAVEAGPAKGIHQFDPNTDQKQTDLKEFIDFLNKIGVKGNDLVEIIKEVHKIGAIHAELVVE